MPQPEKHVAPDHPLNRMWDEPELRQRFRKSYPSFDDQDRFFSSKYPGFRDLSRADKEGFLGEALRERSTTEAIVEPIAGKVRELYGQARELKMPESGFLPPGLPDLPSPQQLGADARRAAAGVAGVGRKMYSGALDLLKDRVEGPEGHHPGVREPNQPGYLPLIPEQARDVQQQMEQEDEDRRFAIFQERVNARAKEMGLTPEQRAMAFAGESGEATRLRENVQAELPGLADPSDPFQPPEEELEVGEVNLWPQHPKQMLYSAGAALDRKDASTRREIGNIAREMQGWLRQGSEALGQVIPPAETVMEPLDLALGWIAETGEKGGLAMDQAATALESRTSGSVAEEASAFLAGMIPFVMEVALAKRLPFWPEGASSKLMQMGVDFGLVEMAHVAASGQGPAEQLQAFLGGFVTGGVLKAGAPGGKIAEGTGAALGFGGMTAYEGGTPEQVLAAGGVGFAFPFTGGEAIRRAETPRGIPGLELELTPETFPWFQLGRRDRAEGRGRRSPVEAEDEVREAYGKGYDEPAPGPGRPEVPTGGEAPEPPRAGPPVPETPPEIPPETTGVSGPRGEPPPPLSDRPRKPVTTAPEPPAPTGSIPGSVAKGPSDIASVRSLEGAERTAIRGEMSDRLRRDLNEVENEILMMHEIDAWSDYGRAQQLDQVGMDFIQTVLSSPKQFAGRPLKAFRAEARRRGNLPLPRGKAPKVSRARNYLEQLGKVVSRDESRAMLAHVRVRADMIDSTDGHRMHRIHGKHGVAEGLYRQTATGKKVWNRVEDQPADVSRAEIGDYPNADVVGSVIANKADKPPAIASMYTMSPAEVGQLVADLKAGFSRYGKARAQGEKTSSVALPSGAHVQATYLLDALEGAHKFSGGREPVTFHFTKDPLGDPVYLTAKHGEAPLTYEAVVMPFRPGEDARGTFDVGFGGRGELGEKAPPKPKRKRAKKGAAEQMQLGEGVDRMPQHSGPRAVGFRDVRTRPASDPLPKRLVQRGQILYQLARDLQLPIQPGRLRAHGWRVRHDTLGFYINRNARESHGVLRIKYWGDIQTNSHEIGHALADRYELLRDMYDSPRLSGLVRTWTNARDRAVREAETLGEDPPPEPPKPREMRILEEMLEVSYDVTQPKEGFAEAVRLWLTQVDTFNPRDEAGNPLPKRLELWREEFETRIAELSKFEPQGTPGTPSRAGRGGGPPSPPRQGAPVPGLGRRDVEKILKHAQRDSHTYFNQGGSAALQTLFGPDGPLTTDVLSKRGDRFRQSVFDDLHGILMSERILRGDAVPDGAYETARRFRGARNIGYGIYRWGVPEINAKGEMRFPGPGQGIRDILAPIATTRKRFDSFLRYTVSRRAQELASQGRERLITPEMMEAGLREGADPAFEVAHEALKAMHRRVLDFAESSGLMNRQTREIIENRNQEYSVAFFREIQASRLSGAGGLLSRRAIARGQRLPELKGSSRNLRHPMEALLLGPARVIEASLLNRSLAKIAALGRERHGGMLLQRLGKDTEAYNTSLGQVQKAVDQRYRRLGMEPPKWDRPGLVEAMEKIMGAENAQPEDLPIKLFGKVPPKEPGVFTVMVGGEPHYWKAVDSTLWRGIQGLHRMPPGEVMRWWNGLRRFVQGAVTSTPDFMSRNAVRDSVWRATMTKAANGYVRNAAKGYLSALRQDETYRAFVAAGGSGSILRESPTATYGDVLRFSQRLHRDPRFLLPTPAKLISNTRQLWRLWTHLGRMIEEGPRIAEFSAARERGDTETHAAYLGREVTTDFSTHGDLPFIIGARQMLPFFGAMMAGSDKMYRAVARDPTTKVATVAKVALFAGANLALHAYNRTHFDEYNELREPWLRHYIHFLWYTGRTNEQTGRPEFEHRMMPTIWDVGMISQLTNQAFDKLFFSDQVEDRSLAWDTAVAVMNNYGVTPAPPIAREIIEQYMGKTIYHGFPMDPPGSAEGPGKLPGYLRGYKSTPQWARAFASLQAGNEYQLSPSRGQMFLQGLASHWIHYGSMVADGLFSPDAPSMHLDDRLIVRNFMAREGKHSKIPEDYYGTIESVREIKNELDVLAGRTSMRGLRFQAPAPELPPHLEERRDELRRYAPADVLRQFEKEQEQINELQAMKRAARTDPRLSSDEKRDREQELHLRILDLQRQALKIHGPELKRLGIR